MTTDTSGSIPIKRGAVLEPRGKVNSTTTWEIDQPDDIGEVFYLPAGEKMDVPENKAFYIKGKDKWYLSQFFKPGQMVGPVIYSETKIGSPKEALLKCYPDEFLGVIFGGFIAASPIFPILYFCDPTIDHSSLNLLLGPILMFLFFMGLGASGLITLYRNRNVRERTIMLLNRYESCSDIACGEINTDKLVDY